MTGKFRALLAALIVVAVASAGALYVGYRNGVAAAARAHDLAFNVATTGDVTALFNGPQGQAQLLGDALQKLETSYYKPVDPQDTIHGESNALTQYLQGKEIAHTSLPAESETGKTEEDSTRHTVMPR